MARSARRSGCGAAARAWCRAGAPGFPVRSGGRFAAAAAEKRALRRARPFRCRPARSASAPDAPARSRREAKQAHSAAARAPAPARPAPGPAQAVRPGSRAGPARARLPAAWRMAERRRQSSRPPRRRQARPRRAAASVLPSPVARGEAPEQWPAAGLVPVRSVQVPEEVSLVGRPGTAAPLQPSGPVGERSPQEAAHSATLGRDGERSSWPSRDQGRRSRPPRTGQRETGETSRDGSPARRQSDRNSAGFQLRAWNSPNAREGRRLTIGRLARG